MSGLVYRPFPIVISAPSGAGKTTLARALVEQDESLEFSISATTRPPRGYEQHGRDYLFADDAEFDRMIEAGELLEWAEVHGRRYGTPKSGLRDSLGRGKSVLLDIDVAGARQVRASFEDAVLIFVLPPSVEELLRRLMGRNSESATTQHRRLNTALQELEAAAEFDYIVLNDEFESALARLHAILTAERQRRSRLIQLDGTLQALRDELTLLIKRS